MRVGVTLLPELAWAVSPAVGWRASRRGTTGYDAGTRSEAVPSGRRAGSAATVVGPRSPWTRPRCDAPDTRRPEAVGVQTLTPALDAAPADGTARRPPRLRWTSLLVPVVVGLALGPLDLLLQHLLAYPFADLANSPAVWALVAFGVGWSDRTGGRWWPAVAGTLTLLLAVEGYYATAVLALGDGTSTQANRAALLWWGAAVAAGVVFGTAGSWARSAHPWRGPLGTASAVGVLLAEAWLDLARLAGVRDDPGRSQDLVQTALVLLVLAAVAAVLAGRCARQRVVGSVLALPLALLGALAFGTLGFL